MAAIAGILYPDLFQLEHPLVPVLDSMKGRANGQQESFTYRNLQAGISGGAVESNSEKDLSLLLDGHIYNQADLTDKLGFNSNSLSEAEIILHSYQKWGTDSFSKFNGDFAFMLFDKKKESIFLVRDRVGVKPLYWYSNGNTFVFASEIKALLMTGIVPQEPSHTGLAAYLMMGFIPQDITPIHGVNKLLPSHYIQIHFDHKKSIHQYWSYSSYFHHSSKDIQPISSDELEYLLSQAIKNRLTEPSETGCFLMGGQGSATIGYLLEKELGVPPKAYTAYFQGENEDDHEIVEIAAKKFDLSLETSAILPDQLTRSLLEIFWHLEEPHADPYAIAIWEMARLAQGKSKVIFSGMGSDELLGGHSRYYPQFNPQTTWLETLLELCAPFLRILIPSLISIHPPSAYKLIRLTKSEHWQSNYFNSQALFSSSEVNACAPALSRFFQPEVFLNKFHHLERIQSNTMAYQYFDIKSRLPDHYMLQFDRLLSVHGIDWRPPFMDARLIEALTISVSPRMNETQGISPLLMKILQQKLPHSMLKRIKKTRKNFLSSWLEPSNLLPLFQHLSHGSLVEGGIISSSWIKKILSSREKTQSHFGKLWTLLSLEIWYRLYINRPISNGTPKETLQEFMFKDIL